MRRGEGSSGPLTPIYHIVFAGRMLRGHREDIRQGAAELGVEVDAIIAQVLEDLEGNAAALGL